MTYKRGNSINGKHYWLTPPALFEQLNLEFEFDYDPCPFPKPENYDGLRAEWGESNYVNMPFGTYADEVDGKKKGPTAWAKKAIEEFKKGKRVVLVYPLDKWVLMLLENGARVKNLGDVKWCSTEDGTAGGGTGQHVACFILEPEGYKRGKTKTLNNLVDHEYLQKMSTQQKLF